MNAVPAPQALAPAAEPAQAVRCGRFEIAVSYAWARSVVERFQIDPVPGAPDWLAGAANVEGRIVAVVDLAVWADADEGRPDTARERLLLGGEGDEAFALRFQGLPRMVRRLESAPDDDTLAALPAALSRYVTGVAGTDDERWPLVDLATLARDWARDRAA